MPSQRPRLLIVDDDRAILTLIGTIAIEEGFDVGTTADGAEALVQLRQRPTDLVLLDLRMPGVAGFDVVARHPDGQSALQGGADVRIRDDRACGGSGNARRRPTISPSLSPRSGSGHS